MSLDDSRSVSRTPPVKRSYPLKLETIPMTSSSYAELKETRHDEESLRSQEEDQYDLGKPNGSTFEADQEFKFKRHRNKQSHGAPSLGERLDNLQDVKKAKWVDNFNSSLPNGRDIDGSERSPPLPPHRQPVQPYMPYMYYYPMPPQGPPMMPFVGSPVHPSQMEGQQYMNSSVSMMPNTSLQPFLPPGQQPKFDQEAPQLLPAPSLYPYNYVQPQQEYAKKAHERKKSAAQNRGRRLSILASQDERRGIVSPHRDVSEKDFYRHIGDTSFGKDLQMRQLFNWCAIRSLRRLEENDAESKKTPKTENGDPVDPKRIAVVIIKEFVNDLRRGNVDIDWEAEDEANSDQDTNDVGEDTELRELFDENDEAVEKKPVRRRKKKSSAEERPKVPNSKNVENEKNLKTLQDRVKHLKDEMDSWAKALGRQKPEAEWEKIESQFTPVNQGHEAHDEPMKPDISHDLTRRLDRLQAHSHLLNSSSKALSVLLKLRRDKLAQSLAATVRNNAHQFDSKSFLKTLSESLVQRQL